MKASTLQLEKIFIGYKKGLWVNKDIQLSLSSGRITGIIGPNGAGKSTLIKGIAGRVPFSKGSMTLNNGKDLNELSIRERAGFVSVLSQNIDPPNTMSVKNFVALGAFQREGFALSLDEKENVKLNKCLGKFNLLNLSDNLVTELSGGEFQRARLAQLDYQNTELVLMDEPASFLDWEYQSFVLNYCRHLAKKENKMVCLAIHDLNMAKDLCDDVCLMKNGKLVLSGPTKNILTGENLKTIFPNSLEIVSSQIDEQGRTFFKHSKNNNPFNIN